MLNKAITGWIAISRISIINSSIDQSVMYGGSTSVSYGTMF